MPHKSIKIHFHLSSMSLIFDNELMTKRKTKANNTNHEQVKCVATAYKSTLAFPDAIASAGREGRVRI